MSEASSWSSSQKSSLDSATMSSDAVMRSESHWSRGHSHSWSVEEGGGHSSDDWRHGWNTDWSQGSKSWCSLGDWINKTIHVQILRESLQRLRSQTTGSLNQVTEGSGQRSSHWSIIDIGSSVDQELGVSLGLSLVESVDSLVATVESSGVSRCIVGSVVVGVGGSITIGSIVVQGVGFRLSQAERGYGENYDHALHVWTVLC